jgi:hypothetical protein
MYLAKIDGWYLERIVWLVAGVVVLASAALSALVNPYWLILTAFAGVNLVVFGATGFCMMANILYSLGARPRLQR